MGPVRHIFHNIISTTKLESAKSLSTVVAREMETVLRNSPTATKHVHVSAFFSLFIHQARVVQKLVSANPGLKVNRGINFS